MTASRYAVYVDISAKIESWDKLSVVVVANGHSRALIISAETKQAALKLLSSAEPPQYTLMALLAYLVLIPDIEKLSSVTLDQDYSGQVAERIIRRVLLDLLRRHRPKLKASAVRMQNVAVASSLNWAFSRMFASSPSRPWLMLAMMPGRSGQARVRMCTAVVAVIPRTLRRDHVAPAPLRGRVGPGSGWTRAGTAWARA